MLPLEVDIMPSSVSNISTYKKRNEAQNGAGLAVSHSLSLMTGQGLEPVFGIPVTSSTVLPPFTRPPFPQPLALAARGISVSVTTMAAMTIFLSLPRRPSRKAIGGHILFCFKGAGSGFNSWLCTHYCEALSQLPDHSALPSSSEKFSPPRT